MKIGGGKGRSERAHPRVKTKREYSLQWLEQSNLIAPTIALANHHCWVMGEETRESLLLPEKALPGRGWSLEG